MPDAKYPDVIHDHQDAGCIRRRVCQEGRRLRRDAAVAESAVATSVDDASAWARHAATANGFGGDPETGG